MPAPSPRRVGFDASALAFPAGGVRRYARELFTALPLAAPDLQFVAIGLPEGVDLPPGTVAGPPVLRMPNNLVRSAVALPIAERRARVDLFHAPAYTAPLTSTSPIVLTIHDVSYARRPEFYAHRSNGVRQWFYRRSARVARRIITDSGFSQREIVAAYGLPLSRVVPVPLGVGPPFAPGPAGDPNPCAPAGVRAPYVLHVGDLHARRDVDVAGEAVIGLARRGMPGAPPLQLVCAGRDYGVADRLRARFSEAGVPELLAVTGPVSEAALVELYRHALLLVYPSRYEGFGLPVLEAMACGLPVVAARAGAVPEVLGEAGVLVEPGDADGLGRSIEALAANASRRDDMRARGLKRAGSFTWAETARRTLDVYRDCLADAS